MTHDSILGPCSSRPPSPGTARAAPCRTSAAVPGHIRALAGGRVDLTGEFTDHDAYVEQVESHATALEEAGYLLAADADAIVQAAEDSDVGQ